jgi:hypothetical protein
MNVEGDAVSRSFNIHPSAFFKLLPSPFTL